MLLAGGLLLLAVVISFFPKARVAGVRSPITVTPGQSLAAAVAASRPGDTIVVKAGTYREKLVTARNGTAKKLITLTAEAGVVLTGDGDGRVFELRHDYYRIEGFEFKDADILLWLQEADHNTITKNFFHHAQGECVRAKYHSTYNTFANNRVENCGLADFVQGGGGKNGEGIYLGTAPEQLAKNPTPETDQTSYNVVRSNTFVTNGNECVDVKEGSVRNVIEYNDCTGQKDPESGGFSSRGDRNVFRHNTVHDNVGAGVRLGGDEETDGIKNDVYLNSFVNNNVGIKVLRWPQGRICGNTVVGSTFSNSKALASEPCG